LIVSFFSYLPGANRQSFNLKIMKLNSPKDITPIMFIRRHKQAGRRSPCQPDNKSSYTICGIEPEKGGFAESRFGAFSRAQENKHAKQTQG
jgi:hypothetical protein